jgi:hypothetical protein
VAASWEKVKAESESEASAAGDRRLIWKPDRHQEPDAPVALALLEILMQIRAELRRRNNCPKGNGPRPRDLP